MPFGVSCQTAFLRGKLGIALASAGSTKRASMKRWQTDRAGMGAGGVSVDAAIDDETGPLAGLSPAWADMLPP